MGLENKLSSSFVSILTSLLIYENMVSGIYIYYITIQFNNFIGTELFFFLTYKLTCEELRKGVMAPPLKEGGGGGGGGVLPLKGGGGGGGGGGGAPPLNGRGGGGGGGALPLNGGGGGGKGT